MAELNISERQAGDVTILDLDGKVTIGEGSVALRTTIRRLLGEGNSLTEIAQTIGVAYKTVANTCSIIKSKLGVERTADLIRVSMEMK